MTDLDVVVKMEGISKHFGGTVASSSVDFDLRANETYVLLGENGTLKETLMNILFGHVRQDDGSIFARGREANIHSP